MAALQVEALSSNPIPTKKKKKKKERKNKKKKRENVKSSCRWEGILAKDVFNSLKWASRGRAPV
jgi:hypothetical protein